MLTEHCQDHFKSSLLSVRHISLLILTLSKAMAQALLDYRLKTSAESMGNDPMFIPVIFHETV